MRARYHHVDVFAERSGGGNPLAVFVETGDWSTAQMQALAAAIGFSETVFVLPESARTSPEATCRVRIFTPGVELPFAGHPTIGTAHLLAALRPELGGGDEARIVLEEGVGDVEVRVELEEGQPVFARLRSALLPEVGPPPPGREEVAAMVGLEPEALGVPGAPGLTLEAISCGMPFLVVPVRDVAALGRSRLHMARWERLLAGYWAPQVYLMTPSGESRYQVRMFGPAVGVVDDPATGAAAAAFAGYLARRSDAFRNGTSAELGWTLDQGIEMGRPSRLYPGAAVRDGEIRAITVGGRSLILGTVDIDVPT